MKSALVYDWFSEVPGGGEKNFEAIYKLYPSPIYTLLRSLKSIQGAAYEKEEFHSSFISKLPGAMKHYRSYLPLFPLAIEQFDLSSYDLVISCSHCAAKGVLTHADQVHLSYCLTPMRYAWDLYHQYLHESNMKRGLKARLAQLMLHYLRMWDVHTSSRVDAFAANSQFVAKRIKKTYGREARVIYPPIDLSFFQVEKKKEPFYLAASRMVPYKKMDLIVEAFSEMPDRRLVVIGDGPELEKVKSKAKKNVEILGYQPDVVLKKHLQQAKALVFAAIEDFGMLPVEAQGCGTPVIAFGKGGVKETILDGRTGVFYGEQTVLSIKQAVDRFEKLDWDPDAIRSHANQFSYERFNREFKQWVEESYALCTS